jgi:predicted metalloprotease
MNLDEAPESSNVQDTRGMGTKIAVGGAGGVILLILGLIFGPDVVNQFQQQDQGNPPPVNQPAGKDDKTAKFVRKVLGTTEKVWEAEFEKMGKTYTPPRLDLFSDKVRTG